MTSNKYKESLENIMYHVLDEQADGYMQPRTVQDYYFEDINVLSELVRAATPKDVVKKTFNSGTVVSCPTCAATFDIKCNALNYCPECGQRLKYKHIMKRRIC